MSTEETQKNNNAKNFNLNYRYWFLEFSLKHNIHNSCNLLKFCYNDLVNPQTLNNARLMFFNRWLVIAIFKFLQLFLEAVSKFVEFCTKFKLK